MSESGCEGVVSAYVRWVSVGVMVSECGCEGG